MAGQGAHVWCTAYLAIAVTAIITDIRPALARPDYRRLLRECATAGEGPALVRTTSRFPNIFRRSPAPINDVKFVVEKAQVSGEPRLGKCRR